MTGPVFIGDELTASGFRLGGARVRVVENDSDLERVFSDTVTGTDPILISAHTAGLLPPHLLDAALSDVQPLLVIVPDATGVQPPDLRKHVRRTLDLE